MFLVLKIGSGFLTFISSSKPTLHSLVCSLPVCRSPLGRGFLVICSQTDWLLCDPQLFPFFLNEILLSELLTHVCMSFSLLFLLWFYSYFWNVSLCFVPQKLICFVCLELVSFEFSQEKLLSSTTPCCAQSTSTHPHTMFCLFTRLFSVLSLYCPSHC